MKNKIVNTKICIYVVAYYEINNSGQWEICYMHKNDDRWNETADVLYADSCISKERAEQLIKDIENTGINKDFHIMKANISVDIEEC